MLANAVANLTKAKHGYLICIIHIAGVSLCLIAARPCTVSLFSFKSGLIVHIHPAFHAFYVYNLVHVHISLIFGYKLPMGSWTSNF